jgi:hypothetical protein
VSAAFDAALERARHIVCGDMEGPFTCHTVDLYVDALEQAHCEEVAALQARLDAVAAAIAGIPPRAGVFRAEGARIYNGDDYGSLVCTVEDTNPDVTRMVVDSVNAVARIREILATDGGTEKP